jgi:ferric-dicitrate binding protein FerR (iron transport regulator)
LDWITRSATGRRICLNRWRSWSPADEDEWQERCETWEQAEAMHAAMVERARDRVPQTDPNAYGDEQVIDAEQTGR